MTLEELKQDPAIRCYIRKADLTLEAMGYTEHSFAHVTCVANHAGELLRELGYEEREVELARIAGFLHDVGNLVNRHDHCQSGALIAMRLLEDRGFPPDEVATVVTAIGNHDEAEGIPVSAVAAALILADKSDVRRSRVRHVTGRKFFSDIHDRVNYSVTRSVLKLSEDKSVVELHLNIDTEAASVMDYFEIFLQRMILCRKAAEKLCLGFHLIINGQRLL